MAQSMTKDELVSIVERAAAAEGVPATALLAIANLESSGNVNARNPRSSASGAFQFVDSTAREYGLTGSKRNDPTAQAYAAARMMATNSRALARVLGREPNVGELYLAHQQGLGGATALLLNPGGDAVDVLTRVYGNRTRAEQAVRLNGGRPGQTAGQFASQWVNRGNQTAARIPPASVPNAVATQLDTRRPSSTDSLPQRITGTSGSTPNNRASAEVPTSWFTPRLAPGNEDIYSYHIPDMTPTSLAGGLGSLTPSIGQRDPVPLPRSRPVTASDIARAPGVTVGSVSTRSASAQALPPLPPSRLPAPRLVETSMQRAAEAQRPSLAAGLAPVAPMTREQQRADNGQLRAAPPAAAQGATIATVPTTPPVASMTREEQRADNGQLRPRASTPLPQTAIPGPNAAPKPEDRLAAGVYPTAPTAVLPAVPPIGVGVASQLDILPSLPSLPISRPVAGFPTPAALRPVSGFPSPMSMRPAAPPRGRPIVGFPTPVVQRPASQAPLRISVQRSSSPAPLTREQQVAAILAQSRGPTAFGHGGSIDGALQPTGTIFGR